jgi:hypothetical protein
MNKLIALSLALVAAFAIMGGVQAAPPVPGGTLTLLTASPALGQVASFEYTLSGGVRECPNGGTNKCARIQVVCSQNGNVVYGEAYPAVHPFNILLGGGGSVWLSNGGPADCMATLYYWDFTPVQTFVPLASVSFTAAG